MRLEGTLDAFSLPDIFSLLSGTRKTGALHLRRDDRHGVVHLRDGAVTGARSDVGRQELARRLVGSGLVDDEALAAAAEQVAEQAPDGERRGLAVLLVERAGLDPAVVAGLAAEQATDAVFDLLRWTEGEFAFLEEPDADDLGAVLSVDAVVAEGRRRLELWGSLVDSVPSPAAVLRVAPAPPADPAVTRDEWALLSLVDGHRTVADLVGLAGRGEFSVVSTLAGMVSRGLLTFTGPADDQLLRRQALLAALEGRPLAVPADPAAVAEAVPAVEHAPGIAPSVPVGSARAAVIPQRREPFVPPRRPDHADAPAPVRALAGAPGGSPLLTAVDGSSALQPEGVAAAPSYIERDPSVDRTLLLRLIAGVRGL